MIPPGVSAQLVVVVVGQGGGPPASGSGSPLLWLGVTVLIVMLAAAAIVWWLRGRRAAGPTCGHCGYAVAGLPTFTCPECGSDLREVGIRRGEPAASLVSPARETVRLYGVLGAWTLAYGAVYVFLGARSYPANPWEPAEHLIDYGLVDAYLWPYRGRSTHTVTLDPASGGYRRLTVTERREARFRGWRNAPQVRWTGDSPNVGLTKFEITIQLDTLAGRTATFDVDPSNLSWRYADPQAGGKVVTGTTLDKSVLWGWMIQNGVDMPSPAIGEECDVVADLVRRSVNSGAVGGAPWATGRLERIVAQQRDVLANGNVAYPFPTTRGTAQDTFGPGWSIYWLSIPFGLGLYSYGANWIWERNKRRTGGGGGASLLPTAGAVTAAPARPGPQRSRTLTILFTDLKDYTARAATTSRQGLMALLATNRRVVETAVAGHGGTIVKTIGDAYLVTFESATNAVLAGLDIQRAAAAANDGAPDADRLELRVGVCTGEVTLADDRDVYGTAVNVASRVQSLADVGEVLFTESTWHAINRPEIAYDDLGPRELKGIATPVRVYRAKVGERVT
jgi:class 3 adenylate cyclase